TLFPTVQSNFGAAANQVPNFLSAPTSDPNNYSYSLFTLGLTLTYNLDLWGANRRQIESLEALAEAQCFQLEGAYLSLAANVVAAAILEASLRSEERRVGKECRFRWVPDQCKVELHVDVVGV